MSKKEPPKNRHQQLQHFRRMHLGRLLHELSLDFSRRMKDTLALRQHPGITTAHTRVFAALPLEGARLTALAERAGITKQSMGVLVRQLEELGYLQREADLADGRASIVRFSRQGMQLLEDAMAVTEEVSGVYAQHLGKRQMGNFQRTMASLVEALGIDIPI